MQLPTNNGNLPKASALNQKFFKKKSLFIIYTAMDVSLKVDHHDSVTSLPVTTGGPVDRVCTGLRARNYTTLI